jgi:nucleotide-binding universal stress UspA family protein
MATLATILAHVDETAHCPPRLALAADLARRHDADLVGVYVVPPLFIPGYMPGDISPALVEVMENQRRTALGKAEAHFAALKRSQPGATWRQIEADAFSGDIVTALASESRLADLSVVGQAGAGEDESRGPGLVPEQLVLRSGRPVLVVPYTDRFATLAERALVAWMDTRESARALADALPLLGKAKVVTVAQVGQGGKEAQAARSKLARVVAFLGRHGIAATSDYVAIGDDLSAGDMLLSRAADLGADLVVMGAYGHSRLRELVLGGVTRELLSSMTVPVLMSH